MGWGSGTADFPYLIAPNTALSQQAARDKTKYVNVSNNYDFAAITKAVTSADVAIVFGNADSGEAVCFLLPPCWSILIQNLSTVYWRRW